ncbi:MAG: SctF chaperone SctG [Chlamydiae bacterium CG10_big_fil_rev_8_21_14_0_10_42_34]|nr:MAG: SctF chaperone SctG [Chlamydiae bacterium CG10_big_fil_rev_8_21_14_0_10_42_34]
MAIKKYKEDFVLLAEAGFIAVNQADEDAALKLFKAAELLDPSNILPKLGFGYLHLHKLELKQAVKNFEDVLDKDPQNDMAKAFMGLCLSMMPDAIAKGEKILTQTLKSKDPMIKEMSGSAIEFVDKFVKTNPGPAGKGK